MGITVGRSIALIAVITIALMSAGCNGAHAAAGGRTLQAFASEQELMQLVARWKAERQRRIEQERRHRKEYSLLAPMAASPMAAPAPMATPAPAQSADKQAGAAESVTNVQHAGVDEGGIVKLHGEHLVILRRGRLFTVDVRDEQLKPLSTIDAFGSGVEPRGAWYDELLVAGDTVVVIGYSYARGGTEIGLFDIDSAGALRYRATYHLRSNDYYSSRNYSSRLIGTKLVFYTPLQLNAWGPDPLASFPAFRRWRPGATPADFKRIAPATRIFRVDDDLDPFQGIALHTVSICDLAKPELDCVSTAVMAPPGRVFYVSPTSVFVWTSGLHGSDAARTESSAVFRIPLDGAAPTAMKTAGTPIDQFSFLEDATGHLNVLLRGAGGGESMFGAERRGGQLAFLRVPLSSFSDGKDSAPRTAYRTVPSAGSGALQNRYVGRMLLYGSGTGWATPQSARGQIYALPYESGTAAQEVPLAHGVDRIEALGSNAIAIGTDGSDLHFTSVRLGERADVIDRYIRKDAAQGETRSHGFYYRPASDNEGLVGLPIIGGGQSARSQLRRESAAVLFLRNQGLSLRELGTLDSRATAGADDACRASCVDWYGNSRPLFIKRRVFALLGYEIVEGRIGGNGIAEIRRVSFAPHWIEQVK